MLAALDWIGRAQLVQQYGIPTAKTVWTFLLGPFGTPVLAGIGLLWIVIAAFILPEKPRQQKAAHWPDEIARRDSEIAKLKGQLSRFGEDQIERKYFLLGIERPWTLPAWFVSQIAALVSHAHRHAKSSFVVTTELQDNGRAVINLPPGRRAEAVSSPPLLRADAMRYADEVNEWIRHEQEQALTHGEPPAMLDECLSGQ